MWLFCDQLLQCFMSSLLITVELSIGRVVSSENWDEESWLAVLAVILAGSVGSHFDWQCWQSLGNALLIYGLKVVDNSQRASFPVWNNTAVGHGISVYIVGGGVCLVDSPFCQWYLDAGSKFNVRCRNWVDESFLLVDMIWFLSVCYRHFVVQWSSRWLDVFGITDLNFSCTFIMKCDLAKAFEVFSISSCCADSSWTFTFGAQWIINIYLTIVWL